MPSYFAAQVARLDAVYADRPYFVGLKARLLAAFQLLMLGFLPLNLVKLWWIESPGMPWRVAVNLLMMLATLVSWWWLWRGRIRLAGSVMVLAAVLPVHGLLLLVPGFAQPLASAIQLFAFGLTFLLLALVFGSRRVALLTLLVVVAGQVAMHLTVLVPGTGGGSWAFAADTLLRDGLLVTGIVFCLGWVLMAMIEATQRRSEQALFATRVSNEKLERLVSARTRDLEAATVRANEAARAKGDFLANMSHEIRTPLNGIIASAELLRQRADLPAEPAEQARLIGESGELLLRLLGDILDFSKMEAGQLVLEPHAFTLATVAHDSINLLAAQARRGGVALEVSLAKGLPARVVGDSFRLRQILLNLLSNAIKFTPSGGRVALTVTAAADAPAAAAGGPVWLSLAVSDTGIGMSASTLTRVFQRFTQADSSTTRRYGGTGLGLSITARLAELMGGRLEARSVLGEGSVFTFHLPLPVPEDGEGASAAAPVAEVLPALGLEVLLAEDNVMNRRLLVAQLARLGCRCTTVEDGRELLELLVREDASLPDVILMDCHMPRLDGWETTLALRAWATDPAAGERQRLVAALPIIALTAAVLPEEQARCLTVGMNAFLAKPVKQAALHGALAAHRRAVA